MTLLDGELAGIHDVGEPADAAQRLRGALPGATVIEAGPLTLAGATPAQFGGVLAALAGRVQRVDALRAGLGLPAEGSVEDALAAGYARLGSGLLARLRGPFALVVWDRDRRRGHPGCTRSPPASPSPSSTRPHGPGAWPSTPASR